MEEKINKANTLADDDLSVTQESASEIPNDAKNDKKDKKSKVANFWKKNGFYVGLAFLVMIMAVVMIFDGNRTLKGDIPYNKTVYTIGDNSISILRYNNEPIVLTSQLFLDNKDQEHGAEAHNGILLSQDEKDIMFVDGLHLIKTTDFTSTKLVGTLRVCDGINNKIISEEASFYYVVSDDFNIILYKTYRISEDGMDLISDLYLYDIKADSRTLLRENMKTDVFSMSNNGKVCLYLDDFTESHIENGEPTYSLYKYENGKHMVISKDVYDLDASVVTGTADFNYPLINKNGDKIIYTTVNYVYKLKNDDIGKDDQTDQDAEEEFITYPTYDMYMYHDGVNELIAESCVQMLVSNDFSQIVFIDDVVEHLSRYDEIGFAGTYSHYDIETGVKTLVMEDVFGFAKRSVLGYADNAFIDANFYFKNYDINDNTATLYTIRNGKQIFISDQVSIGVSEEFRFDFISFARDYKDIYVFKSYIEKTSSLLYRYTLKSNGDLSEYICEEKLVITDFRISLDGNYLVFNSDGRLIVISPSNVKKTIEREGVSSFNITEGGRYLYYYKETTIGAGALYYYDLIEGTDSVKLLSKVNEVWNYEGDMVLFRINIDYVIMTGDLYLTDFKQFELMSENVYSQIKTKVTER